MRLIVVWPEQCRERIAAVRVFRDGKIRQERDRLACVHADGHAPTLDDWGAKQRELEIGHVRAPFADWSWQALMRQVTPPRVTACEEPYAILVADQRAVISSLPHGALFLPHPRPTASAKHVRGVKYCAPEPVTPTVPLRPAAQSIFFSSDDEEVQV